MAGCATPTSSAGHALAGTRATPKLTSHPDHAAGPVNPKSARLNSSRKSLKYAPRTRSSIAGCLPTSFDHGQVPVAAGGDDRDPQSIAPRACARELRSARYRAYRRRSDRARPRLPAAKGQELSRYALPALVSLRALGRFDSLATQRPGTQSGTEGW